MARTTLNHLIQHVRTMTFATADAYTIGTANYWDNDQIQLILDQHRFDFYDVQLRAIPEFVGGGSSHYYTYESPFRFLESTGPGGSSIFVVKDGLGATLGTTEYTADYVQGKVIFTDNQGGSIRYLTGRSYDLSSTAVDILEAWAARLKLEFDFQTDSQEFRRSQKFSQLERLAQQYREAKPIGVLRTYRSDVPGAWKDYT